MLVEFDKLTTEWMSDWKLSMSIWLLIGRMSLVGSSKSSTTTDDVTECSCSSELVSSLYKAVYL